MPAITDKKRNNPDSSPSKSPNSQNPTKASKMDCSQGSECLAQGSSECSSDNSELSNNSLPAPPIVSSNPHIEELVEAELEKHSQLDQQSRLIISLTVSIAAKFFSPHSLTNSQTAHPNVPQIEDSVARIDLQQKTFENNLSELASKLENRFSDYDKTICDLNSQISDLKNTVSSLTKTNASLQYSIDDVDQYERRDTLVFSGKCIPKEVDDENSTDVIIKVLRQVLFMHDLTRSDINVCHRLGGKRKDSRGNFIDRPIICKFISRTVKREIKQSCLDLKPDLYANESLTNIRREIFTKLRFVRKQYKAETKSEIFTQLYTNDGKIMVKLQNKQKYTVTNPHNLDVFLKEYPDIKARYENINLRRQ